MNESQLNGAITFLIEFASQLNRTITFFNEFTSQLNGAITFLIEFANKVLDWWRRDRRARCDPIVCSSAARRKRLSWTSVGSRGRVASLGRRLRGNRRWREGSAHLPVCPNLNWTWNCPIKHIFPNFIFTNRPVTNLSGTWREVCFNDVNHRAFLISMMSTYNMYLLLSIFKIFKITVD